MQDSLALELIETLKNMQVKDGKDGKDGFCFPLNNMFSFGADDEGNVYYYTNEEGETSKKLLGNFKGKDGIGTNGLNAYEIAVKNGFVGTEIEWLESLKLTSNRKLVNVLKLRTVSDYITNTTSNDIEVSVSLLGLEGVATGMLIYLDDVNILFLSADSTSRRCACNFTVPSGSKYKVVITGGEITTWTELKIV